MGNVREASLLIGPIWLVDQPQDHTITLDGTDVAESLPSQELAVDRDGISFTQLACGPNAHSRARR